MSYIFWLKMLEITLSVKKHIPVRRAHVMKLCHFDFHVFFPRFMLFPTFLKTYKTHKGNRTHELTPYAPYFLLTYRATQGADPGFGNGGGGGGGPGGGGTLPI